MAASTGDKITDIRNAARPNSARATGTRSSGGTSLACDNLSGWPTASKVHFVTYQLNSSSTQVAGTQLDCTGIVSGNTIGSITVVDGTDTGNSVNDVVEMIPTAAWGQDLADALTNQHSRTGTHTVISATSITTTGNSSIGGNETVAGTLGVTGATTLTGAATLASLVLNGSLTGTGLGAQVLTQVNAGTAGGTMSYINLGGIKLLWAASTNGLLNGSGGPTWTFTLPTNFFNTITVAIPTWGTILTTSEQNLNISSATTVTITIVGWASGSTAAQIANLFVIGT